jgi:hypothetical protein
MAHSSQPLADCTRPRCRYRELKYNTPRCSARLYHHRVVKGLSVK